MIIGPPKERDPLVSNELVLALRCWTYQNCSDVHRSGMENNTLRYHCVVQHGASTHRHCEPRYRGAAISVRSRTVVMSALSHHAKRGGSSSPNYRRGSPDIFIERDKEVGMRAAREFDGSVEGRIFEN